MYKEENDFHTPLDINKLYHILLNEIDVGIHVIDEEGKTIIYNRKMMEIESMDSKDVLYKNPLEVFAFQKNQSSTLIEALKLGKTRKNIKQTYFNNKGKEITTINDTFPIIDNGKIKGAIEIAKDITRLRQSIKANVLRNQHTRFTFHDITGNSEAVHIVIEEAKRAARTSSSILIVGETGTGKELFAQSIHNESSRAAKAFISQNCAAIPETLMESLLFGTKKGAFTGAMDNPGLFEEANGGTLLLDEINSLSPALQAKLLRVIQEKKMRRVGDIQEKDVDVRIIATINEDPVEAIAENRLRKDLYYRLSVVTLFLPSLRDRKEDILPLVQRFITKYNIQFDLQVKDIDEEVKELLYKHDWPGNVRELEHMVEGAMNLIEDKEIITPAHLPTRFYRLAKKDSTTMDLLESASSIHPVSPIDFSPKPLKETMEDMERNYIQQVFEANQRNVSQTAKVLGISRQNLQYRLKKYNI
ncbi:sigma 54-interacting transcriptional regulator [Bacillus sp. 165]|uniref:sigma-54 interaction domain-containing protein n=1 Tax=Bacillus sp. 165 TaxID=1529117 RepID=UPI001AD956D4|nr:sigma 54-interacting transcriptional regulator [Bacillus sp. 165]MBO9131028.1 sigma 54-interacting transcriptional regulator [Bacillus sp. 165]